MTKRKKPSPHYKGNNEGGFGNPPVASQFKPGNRDGGRKKGKKSVEAALRRAFKTPLEIVARDNSRRKVHPVDALAIRAVQLGVKGGGRDNERALELAKQFGPQDLARGDSDISRLTDAELDLYGYLVQRCVGLEPDDIHPEYRAYLRSAVGYTFGQSDAKAPELYKGPVSLRSPEKWAWD